jgi:hypothetical protein
MSMTAVCDEASRVRMLGNFRMSYHYLTVNGRDLDGERDACATVETGMPSSLTPGVASGERPRSHVD